MFLFRSTVQSKTDTPFLVQDKLREQTIKPDAEVVPKLIESMLKVDLEAPDAILNSTTISDNNSGRILL